MQASDVRRSESELALRRDSDRDNRDEDL
ncbi:hypothetical protein LINPERPRIM_LOCUS16942 [Linum perenne]